MLALSAFKVVRDHPHKHGVCVCICPHCSDTKGHVELDTVQGVWYCFRCSRGGRVNMGGTKVFQKTFRVKKKDLDISLYPPAPEGGRVWRYLSQVRKIPPSIIRTLDLRGGPSYHHAYLPIKSWEGTIQNVAGRNMGHAPNKLRWVFDSKGEGVSRCLWGIHRVSPRSVLVVVEGIMDAVWSRTRVCTFGSHISPYQMGMIADLSPSQIIIFFDGDAPGRAAAGKAWTALKRAYSFPVHVIHPPDNMDPDMMGLSGDDYIRDRLHELR